MLSTKFPVNSLIRQNANTGMHDHWLRRVFRPEQSEHARAEHFPVDARPRQLGQDVHREVARRRAVERRDAHHRVRQGDDQVQRIQSHAL